jgi:hypothetical protein
MTHDEFVNHPGVSISSLRLLLTSPLAFYKRKVLGQREETEPTAAQRLGSLVDSAILDFDEFDSQYASLPRDIITPVNAKQREFCKKYVQLQREIKDNPSIMDSVSTQGIETQEEWLWKKAYRTMYSVDNKTDNQVHADAFSIYTKYMRYLGWLWQNEGKIVISVEQSDIINGINTRLMHNEEAQRLLQNGDGFESDIFEEFKTKDKIVVLSDRDGWTIFLKGEIDAWGVSGRTVYITDLKTTASSFGGIIPSIRRYGYHVQLAFYKKIFCLAYPQYADHDFVLSNVFARTKPEYEVQVVRIRGKVLQEAEQFVEDLLDTYCWHLDGDEWERPRHLTMHGDYIVLNDWDQTWDLLSNSDPDGIESSKESLVSDILESSDFE